MGEALRLAAGRGSASVVRELVAVGAPRCGELVVVMLVTVFRFGCWRVQYFLSNESI